jgi:hypothetical protein
VYNDKDFEEKVSRMLDLLVMKGLVEIASVDANTGEFLYQFSPDLIEMIPNLEGEMERMFLEGLDTLWVKGFLSMDRTEENPIVSLTNLAFDPESVATLPLHERTVLYTIMEAMKHEKGL